MKNKRFIAILGIGSMLLLIPLIAMQFTTEVSWDLFDFIVAGILLFGTGLLCELVFRKVRRFQNRMLLCSAVLLVFFLVWAELAVGIFGTPFA